jgi:hypothetical protein
MRINYRNTLLTMIAACVIIHVARSFNQKPIDVRVVGFTEASTPMEKKDTSSPSVSPQEKEKLKAIYDSAPSRRAAVDSSLSQGKPTTRVSQKDGEASNLEAILKRQGWSGHTVTEGVR